MQTDHKLICADAADYLKEIDSNSAELIVTSPPYPMIEMWDQLFTELNSLIGTAISGDPYRALNLMHEELNKVWNQSYRILKPGGHLIINIGDATRTISSNFQLFSNHSKILQNCLNIGFQNLPNIIWRKQTNSPNKFMGSGMLPPGAYVTLEHEYILIFRKGNKREFKSASEKQNRNESGYFWEERNIWFSDIWDLKGIRQTINSDKIRDRSGAFPFELAYRLINMFSVKGDTIIDPFGGTGTTSVAASACERNSIHIEIDPNMNKHAFISIKNAEKFLNDYISNRIIKHNLFVSQRKGENKVIKYFNEYLNTPVMTRQEKEIQIRYIEDIKTVKKGNDIQVKYTDSAEPLSGYALAF